MKTRKSNTYLFRGLALREQLTNLRTGLPFQTLLFAQGGN
jgi:hypothetical protein